ncbi:papain-like cysteine protease family protein [Kribbella sp.]|uniref:papain-like cysteine protease family protein n=1 Tax=Kribbella sp. TaxID=1871183 RepID=UPI002D6CE651|nr:papain-like cysteine protease family protein [Kribbella sp.]HZX08659.1 papain-like cysteine protease family protein [Kribbella sp.]
MLGGQRQQHRRVLRLFVQPEPVLQPRLRLLDERHLPNNQATLGNDQNAFRAIGISTGSYVSGTLAFGTLVSEIAAGRPVMTRIGWTSGGGHMMDIIGYDSSNSTIEYYDPWPDDQRYNYSTYGWYQSNAQFTWTHSLYRIGA